MSAGTARAPQVLLPCCLGCPCSMCCVAGCSPAAALAVALELAFAGFPLIRTLCSHTPMTCTGGSAAGYDTRQAESEGTALGVLLLPWTFAGLAIACAGQQPHANANSTAASTAISGSAAQQAGFPAYALRSTLAASALMTALLWLRQRRERAARRLPGSHKAASAAGVRETNLHCIAGQRGVSRPVTRSRAAAASWQQQTEQQPQDGSGPEPPKPLANGFGGGHSVAGGVAEQCPAVGAAQGMPPWAPACLVALLVTTVGLLAYPVTPVSPSDPSSASSMRSGGAVTQVLVIVSQYIHVPVRGLRPSFSGSP